MYTHINKQLANGQQNIYRLQKIETMLSTLKAESHIIKEKSKLAKINFEKENKEYEKIAEKSVSSILFSVMGTLEKKVEKERLEALSAELKYSQYIKDLEDISNQISALETEKMQYIHSQDEYDKFYEEKLQALIKANNSTAHEIMDLRKRIELSENNLYEVVEALYVGKQVQQGIASALKSLNSAENWGIFDILGFGLVAGVMKHSHIDDASNAAQNVHSLLRRFRTELADIQILEDIQIDIGNFAVFADFFFDGLMADWFMQSKINASQQSINNVQTKVQQVMKKLSILEHYEEDTLEKLNTEINTLILNA